MIELRDGVIELREGVAAPHGPSIAAVVAAQKTLEDVVRWGLSQRPARLIESVVVQDEYTHDVVLPLDAQRWLVFDTT